MTAPSTSWKEATDTTSGDASKFGAPDGLNKNNQLFNGDLNVDNVDINSPWFFRTAKCYFLNTAGTYGFIIDSSSAIVADRTVTLPLLTGDDAFVMADFIQTIQSKKIGNWLDHTEVAAPSSPAASTHRTYYDSTSNMLSTKNSSATVEQFTTNEATQTLTNKTLTTPTITVLDNAFTIQDSADVTKTFVVSLGGATTSKGLTLISSHTDDRSITLPNVTSTLAILGANIFSAAQDLGDNALTSVSDIELVTISADDGTLAQTVADSTGITTFVSGTVLVAPALGVPASGDLANCDGYREAIGIAASDETTALVVADDAATFRMPYGFTLTDVRATVTTAPTGAAITIDIEESGTTVLSTLLTIDATEKTSTTAATPPVISDSALADDAEISINIDVIGSSVAGAGLKIWLIGSQT